MFYNFAFFIRRKLFTSYFAKSRKDSFFKFFQKHTLISVRSETKYPRQVVRQVQVRVAILLPVPIALSKTTRIVRGIVWRLDRIIYGDFADSTLAFILRSGRIASLCQMGQRKQTSRDEPHVANNGWSRALVVTYVT